MKPCCIIARNAKGLRHFIRTAEMGTSDDGTDLEDGFGASADCEEQSTGTGGRSDVVGAHFH
jgi:hypothetical protein